MSAQWLLFGALIIVLVAFCLRTSKVLVWGNLITYIYIYILGQFSLQILMFIILLLLILFYFSGLIDSNFVFAIGLIFMNFVGFRSYLEAHSLQSPKSSSRPFSLFSLAQVPRAVSAHSSTGLYATRAISTDRVERPVQRNPSRTWPVLIDSFAPRAEAPDPCSRVLQSARTVSVPRVRRAGFARAVQTKHAPCNFVQKQLLHTGQQHAPCLGPVCGTLSPARPVQFIPDPCSQL